MRSLGIRVSGEEIYLGIYSSEEKKVISEQIILPKIIDFPNKLKFLRHNIIDLLNEYKIKFVGIKIIEYTSQNKDVNRIFIEGVLQESLASNNDIIYFIENKQTISNTLNIKNKYDLLSEKIKEFTVFMETQSIDFDKKTNPEKREAILVSLSAYKKGLCK